jgi:hypothetical protein
MKTSVLGLKFWARLLLAVFAVSSLSGCGAVRGAGNRAVGLMEGVSGRNFYRGNDVPYIPSIPQ